MKSQILKIGCLTGAIYALITFGVNLTSTRREPEIADETSAFPKRKTSKTTSRTPASVAQKLVSLKPGRSFQETTRDSGTFGDVPDVKEASASGGGAGMGSWNPPTETTNGRRRSPPVSNSSSSKRSTSAAPAQRGPVFKGSPLPINPPAASGGSSSTGTTSTPSTTNSSSITCTAATGGGSFDSPITVALSCSRTAEIKYCLSETSCCDPKGGSGVTYTGPIAVGVEEKTYCLSFYGEANDKDSLVVAQNYIFNATTPDLLVAHNQRYFQTTQLEGLMHVTSNTFGKNDFEVGVANLKSHDPGPSGLNLDCQTLVTTFNTLTAPVATIPLAPVDTQTLSANTQLNIFLDALELGYGVNYVTSYVINRAYSPETYACQTNAITLEDFAYFQHEVAHGEVGTSTVREFSGGFTPYGFFEPAPTVYRGPAGVSQETQTGQQLRQGLFGIFF